MGEQVRYEIKLDGVDQFEKNMNHMNNSVNNFEGTIGKVAKTLGALFVIDKIVEFGKAIVDTGAKFEAYEIGLSTLLHGEKEAHEAFEQIKKDAQTTPFDTESLLQAERALIGAGESAKGARQVVLDLGNAIAATGGGSDELGRMAVNLQQIKNIGYASALDIKQFAFAGINIYELLAKSTGKTVDQVKNMKVSYEVLAKALKDAHAAGGIYEGGLEKMGKSTQVQLSNIKDTVTFLMVDIFNTIKPAIDEVLGVFNNIMGGIKEIMPDIIKSFSPLWDTAKEIGGVLFEIGKDILPHILKMIDPIVHAFQMFWSLAMRIIEPLERRLAPILETVGRLVNRFVEEFEMLMPVLEPAFDLIGDVLGLVMDVTTALVNAGLDFTEWIESSTTFKILWETISSVIQHVIDGVRLLLGIEDKGQLMSQEEFDKILGGVGKPEESAVGQLGKNGAGKPSPGPELKPGNDSSKVTGTKQVIINVSIQKLVETIKIMPQTVRESAAEMERYVAQALMGAVNQFSASTDI